MNRIQLLILSILHSNGAMNRHSAMTVREIIATEQFEYQENTFYKCLKNFMTLDLVNTGIKEGRALTFFITRVGIKKLEEEKNQ